MIKRTRDPLWNEEFQFMLEEPPLNENIHIDVMSKRTGISFRSKVCNFLHSHCGILSVMLVSQTIFNVGIFGICGYQSH